MADPGVIYGVHLVLEALCGLQGGSGQEGALLIAEGRRGKEISHARRLAQECGMKVQEVPAAKLDGLSAGRQHQGIAVRVGEFRYTPLEDLLEVLVARPSARLLVLDQVQDPGNFGALLRSAAAFGMAGVVVTRDRAAPVTPVVIKASAGAAFRVPVVRVTNLARTLDTLHEAGFFAYGAADQEGAQRPDEISWSGHVAVVLGAEGVGLRRLTRERCDGFVAIPQSDAVESLNVSVAGAILMYEAARGARE